MSTDRAGVTTTRTLNPLHFEDLDPHRFEDLVRQMAYDFRPWRLIEATGRSGSDEGMDVRAVEADVDWAQSSDDDETSLQSTTSGGRVWVIQCKREKAVGPARAREIAAACMPSERGAVYGFILAAPCDFSKRARDALRGGLRDHGVQECYVWGRAELEDMLFQPKNDHLLFAYFGVSLQVRRRSMATLVKSRLAKKRLLIKVLGGLRAPHFTPVLVRAAEDTAYPYAQVIDDFAARPRWRYYYFHSHQPPDHVALVVERHLAYMDDTGKGWDAIFQYDESVPRLPEVSFAPGLAGSDLRRSRRYRDYWEQNVPRANQAYYVELGCIPYDAILAIDEDGDACNEGPHLILDPSARDDPFGPSRATFVERANSAAARTLVATEESRVLFFPEAIP